MATVNDLFGVLGRPLTNQDIQNLDPLAGEVTNAQMPIQASKSPFYLYNQEPNVLYQNTLSDLLSSIGNVKGLPKNISKLINRMSKPVGKLTMEELQKTPGYKSRLRAGTKAVDIANAAKGYDLSGPAAKALERYGQEFASNEYAAENDRRNQRLEMNQQRLKDLLNFRLGKQGQFQNYLSNVLSGVQSQSSAGYQQQLGEKLQNLGLSQDQLARVSGMLTDIFNRYGVMAGIGQNATSQLTSTNAGLGQTGAGLTAQAGQNLADSQIKAYQQKASGLDSLVSDLIGAGTAGAGVYGKYFYTPKKALK